MPSPIETYWRNRSTPRVGLAFGASAMNCSAGCASPPAVSTPPRGRERDERVGERVFNVVRIGNQHALAVAIDDVRRNSTTWSWAHVGEHHGARADARVLADGDVAQQVGVVAEKRRRRA